MAAAQNKPTLTNDEASQVLDAHGRNALIMRALPLALATARRRIRYAGEADDIMSVARLATVEAVHRWVQRGRTGPLVSEVFLGTCRAISRYRRANYCLYVPAEAWRKLAKAGELCAVSVLFDQDIPGRNPDTSIADRLVSHWPYIEIAPGVFPCIAAVERMLDEIEEPRAAAIFREVFGLGGCQARNFAAVAKARGITVNSARKAVVLCAARLRRLVNGLGTHFSCKECHKEVRFARFSTGRQMYCSKRCKRRAECKHYEPRLCDQCSRTFTPRSRNDLRCGVECRRRAKAAAAKAEYVRRVNCAERKGV